MPTQFHLFLKRLDFNKFILFFMSDKSYEDSDRYANYEWKKCR